MGGIIYFLQRYCIIPSRNLVNGTGFFKDAEPGIQDLFHPLLPALGLGKMITGSLSYRIQT
jgi:hypothetical protein